MPTHFYTVDPGERDSAIHNLGSSDEGTACSRQTRRAS